MIVPPQPLVVVTGWGLAGVPPLSALFVTAAVAGFIYWRVLQRARPVSLPAVCIATALGLAAAWLAPVLFSSDVYAYAAYGEMARIGLDPYAPAALNSPDAWVRAAQVQWITAFPICVYGPLFVAFARFVVTTLAPLGPLVTLDAFRVATCAAFLLCVTLAYAAFPGDRASRLRAAATIGLNPAAIWCAVEGHNDAIALAAVLTGFVLVHRRHVTAGAAVVALSSLIKAPGAAAAIALAFVDRRARVGAIAGIGAAIVLSWPLIHAVATRLSPHGSYAPQASLQAVFAPLGPFVAVGAACAVALFFALRGAAQLIRQSGEGWIWLGVAAWLLVPNPYPWYALWLVALAALAPRSRIGRTAILLSFTSLLRYVPDAIGAPQAPLSVALGAVTILPLVVPLRYNGRPA